MTDQPRLGQTATRKSRDQTRPWDEVNLQVATPSFAMLPVLRVAAGLSSAIMEPIRAAAGPSPAMMQAVRAATGFSAATQDAIRAAAGPSPAMMQAVRAATGFSAATQDAIRAAAGLSTIWQETMRHAVTSGWMCGLHQAPDLGQRATVTRVIHTLTGSQSAFTPYKIPAATGRITAGNRIPSEAIEDGARSLLRSLTLEPWTGESELLANATPVGDDSLYYALRQFAPEFADAVDAATVNVSKKSTWYSRRAIRNGFARMIWLVMWTIWVVAPWAPLLAPNLPLIGVAIGSASTSAVNALSARGLSPEMIRQKIAGTGKNQ